MEVNLELKKNTTYSAIPISMDSLPIIKEALIQENMPTVPPTVPMVPVIESVPIPTVQEQSFVGRDLFITQFDMITSTELSATGKFSISPSLNSTFL